MQRLAAAVSAATLGVGLLAGCGTDPADEKKNDDAPTAGGGAFPVTVEHAFGKTEVKQAPKRVVTVGYTDDQAVLAFGIKPVGMVDQYPTPPGRLLTSTPSGPGEGAVGDARPEVVMKNGDAGPNFEKIASCAPT